MRTNKQQKICVNFTDNYTELVEHARFMAEKRGGLTSYIRDLIEKDLEAYCNQEELRLKALSRLTPEERVALGYEADEGDSYAMDQQFHAQLRALAEKQSFKSSS